MATAIKKCRVCGKMYEACHTQRPNVGFRWQEVACSPECGSIYLARIEESRKTANSNLDADKNESIISIDENDDDIDEVEIDEELDEYFDSTEDL